MKRVLFCALLVVAGAAVVVSRRYYSQPEHPTTAVAAAAASPAEETAGHVAAPGRVEPISEEIVLSAELPGKLQSVLVEEGDNVIAGQPVAHLASEDYQARVRSAAAAVESREAELRRVINGARGQERREAAAAVSAASAKVEQARTEYERRRALYASGDVGQIQVDHAQRELEVTQKLHDAAQEHFQLVDDAAREEDRARGEAEVLRARADLGEARALLEKTTIRSPIRGIVLRKHLRTGESVDENTPVVTVADVSRLRVRADVDEIDVARVRTGQRAYVTAAAYRGQKFWGHVVRLGQVLGRKNFRTNEPTERVDTKILEVLIEFDSRPPVPAGLRVDAFLIP
jgi:ABC exporter DevB family membrane fusion protein